MAQQIKAVGRRVLSELVTWTIAGVITITITLAILAVYNLVVQKHHNDDITRLDNRIDLECVKKLP
mgnify:CR=1 FL=1